MSLKIYFLHSHFDFFPNNLHALSDKHGENFTDTLEKRFRGKSISSKLGEYFWLLERETFEDAYKRQTSGSILNLSDFDNQLLYIS